MLEPCGALTLCWSRVLVPSLCPAPENFLEPRLIVVTDPRTDAQAVKESSYMGIPVLAFADSDS